MSIEIKVSASMVSVKKKGISLVDCRIEKSKKRDKAWSTAKIQVPVKHSSGKVDKLKRQNSDCTERNDIVKKKERSSRKLIKYENRYKHLEKASHEYISPRENQNILETNDSKSRKPSASILLGLSQQVLHLEREVNAVLNLSRCTRQRCDYKSNNIINDNSDAIDFLLKLDEVKRKLFDEFDFNLSNKNTTWDDSRQFENATNYSTAAEPLQSFSECSSFSDDVIDTNIEGTTTESDSRRLDEDKHMIDLSTEEILSNSIDANKQTSYSNVALVLSDIQKIQTFFSTSSLLHRGKPPASLICKQYRRMDIDFTIHELSAIYETDSDGSRGQATIASLKYQS